MNQPNFSHVSYASDYMDIAVKEVQNHFKDVLKDKNQSYDMVLFLSILHHFVIDQEKGDALEILQHLDKITNKVLILDTGQNHESWFKNKIPDYC